MAQARLADVDCCNPGIRFEKCIFGRLRRPAARNQNGKVFAIASGRPEQVKIRATSFAVLPQSPVFLKIIGVVVVVAPLGRRLRWRGLYPEDAFA